MSVVAPFPPPPPASPVQGPGGPSAPNAAGLMQLMGTPPPAQNQDAMAAERFSQDMKPMFEALRQVQKLLDNKPHLTPLVETFLKQMARSKGRRGVSGDSQNAQPAPLTSGSATPTPQMAGGAAAPPAPAPRPFPTAI